MLDRGYAGKGLKAVEMDSVCRQDTKEDFTEDFLRPDAAEVCAAAVHRGFTVITQNKHLLQWNLKGELQIAEAESPALQVRLVQGFAVDGDDSVLADIHRVSSKGNDTLDNQLVVVVKGTDIAGVEL